MLRITPDFEEQGLCETKSLQLRVAYSRNSTQLGTFFIKYYAYLQYDQRQDD